MFNMITKKILKPLQNEKGSVLLFSYFAILILLGVGAAFVVMSSTENLVAERQYLSVSAFQLAEAGIERAMYDLRMDFINDSTPSWADGDINGMSIGPNSSSYYDVYSGSSGVALNNGNYYVQFQNVGSSADDIRIRSTGTVNDVDHTVEVLVKMTDASPWQYAIFAGAGASGTMVNGNVDIRGSVLILGDGLNPGDMAIDIGGTAEIVGNNYAGLDSSLAAKVPALDTVVFGGETVETLNAVLRVKKGIVGISGSSSVGQPNATGNAVKETVDGVYVTDGFGGNQGSSGVYSDNGTTNGYDLGETATFPSLSDPYPGYSSYQDYLRNNALVLTNELTDIRPNSNFSYSNGNGSISMDGSGNLTISGIVYVDGNNNIGFNKQGSNKTITYTGTGSLLATGSVDVNTNLVTNGNNSFPNNIIGIMTPNDITFNEAQIDAMGMFYAENQINALKQTDITGTFVSNYFNMGTNVPAIYQVPDAANNLPPGLIGQSSRWYMIVGWMKN